MAQMQLIDKAKISVPLAVSAVVFLICSIVVPALMYYFMDQVKTYVNESKINANESKIAAIAAYDQKQDDSINNLRDKLWDKLDIMNDKLVSIESKLGRVEGAIKSIEK